MKLIDLVLLAIIAACLLSLMGCSDRTEPLPVIAAPAVLRNWSPEEECALALALDPIPQSSILWTLHDDWSRMRREIGPKPVKSKGECKTNAAGVRLLS